MKVTDKELDTLLKSEVNHSFNKEFKFRGAPESSGKSSVLKRFVAIAAAVLLVAGVVIAAFITTVDKKTPAPAEVTEGVGTEEAIITDEANTKITENDDAGTAFVSNTEAETKEGIAYAPGSKFHYGFIVDYYEKDKTEPIVLSKEQYGRQKWLSKEIIKQYEMDLPTKDLSDDHDYVRYNDSFYGYAKTGDEYELEIKLKTTNEWAGDEYLLRVEADDSVEILSDILFKGVFPTVNDPTWSLDPGDYISLPLRFRFTGDTKWADFRIYIFVRSAGNEFHSAHDNITEAEEYFANGYSMADKAYPGWRERDHSPFLTAVGNHYEARFIEIKGYDFLLDSGTLYGTTELYERAALYFGDVDENGVPLFITEPDIPDYQNPCKIPMLSEIQGYSDKSERNIKGRDMNNASPDLSIKLQKETNSKGGIVREYHIELSGYINWSINDEYIHGSDDGLRPAKDVCVILYDVSNSATNPSALRHTFTSSSGYYSFSFDTIAPEPLDLRVDLCLDKSLVKVSDFDYPTGICQTIRTINDIPVNASYTASYNFINGTHGSATDNKNRAVSAHQSIMLGYNYIQALQYIPFDPTYGLNVILQDTNHTYYFTNDTVINLLYRDAFDWDVSQHEFGHYIEDLFGFFYSNSYDEHSLIYKLMSDYEKSTAIRIAWSEGWATFFAINAQRVMNATNLNIPYVGDTHYNNNDEPVVGGVTSDVNVDIEYLIDYAHNDSIYLGETSEATIAALLLDFVDGTSSTDNDYTEFSDSTIWSIIIGDEADPDDGCKTLSDFMNAFHDTTLLSGSQKLICLYLLRRYELNPYNVSVTNVGSGSPLVSRTNISAYSNFYNRIRFFDTSFNEIGNPIFTTYQTSYNIPAATWSAKTTGRTAVFIVVEGMTALDLPMTYRYYSQVCYVVIP